MRLSELIGFSLFIILTAYNEGINSKSIFEEVEDFKVPDDPDTERNVSELITSKGYPVEDHTVQTEDGFILSLQRIPHGRKESKSDDEKQVVFLQHGILTSATDFVINFPEQSLGFILADAGYDVWLGNTRGNAYSRKNVKYSPDSNEFWNFSFDEMAKYDLPAMIDYVLEVTGEEKLIYIGHSQGTTAAFAMLSENREYNDKVKLFVALAPIATVGHMTSAVKFIAPFTSEIHLVLSVLGVREFLPNRSIIKFLKEKVCESKIQLVCENIIFLIFGYDQQQLNETRLGVYAAHTPSGSSTKSLVHYGQMVNSKKFRKYDYSPLNNLHYDQDSPPEYDVSKITAPVALFWASNDKLADTTDVMDLKGKLTSLVKIYKVPFPKFNHGDFVMAIDAKRLLYDEVLKLLSKYA